MIEAWCRALKHQWLFLHSLDSVTTVRRLVEFYVQEHNRVLPHSAFRGQTPDEMYFDRGDAVPADLMARARCRSPGPRGGEPIGGVRDVPINRGGRVNTPTAVHREPRPVRLKGTARNEPIASATRRRNVVRNRRRSPVGDACAWMTRTRARNPECPRRQHGGLPRVPPVSRPVRRQTLRRVTVGGGHVFERTPVLLVTRASAVHRNR